MQETGVIFLLIIAFSGGILIGTNGEYSSKEIELVCRREAEKSASQSAKFCETIVEKVQE